MYNVYVSKSSPFITINIFLSICLLRRPEICKVYYLAVFLQIVHDARLELTDFSVGFFLFLDHVRTFGQNKSKKKKKCIIWDIFFLSHLIF